MRKLPQSVLSRGVRPIPGFGQTGYWHYNVFWGPEYRRRLSHAGFDKHWKPVVDRIPTDDPDTTLNFLPGKGWSP